MAYQWATVLEAVAWAVEVHCNQGVSRSCLVMALESMAALNPSMTP